MLTVKPFVIVTFPSPLIENTVVVELFLASTSIKPEGVADRLDRTVATVPVYVASEESTSIAAREPSEVVLVSASVLLTVTAPDSVDVPVIVAAPLTASVLLSVAAPVIVAAPPTSNVLVPEIVTAPVSVDVVLTDRAPTIVAPPPVTCTPPAIVTCPSPFTRNTAAGVLPTTPEIRLNPAPPSLFDRTFSTVPAYVPSSVENTSIALVAAPALLVVLVSASVLLTVTAPVSVDAPETVKPFIIVAPPLTCKLLN